jgi:hypothetical protein
MAKRQRKKEEDFSWLDSSGQRGRKEVDRTAIAGTIEGKAADFIDNVIQHAIKYKLVNSGALTSPEGYRTDLTTKKGLTTLEIYMIFYGLFQDRGVKGFPKSNGRNNPDAEKNAPDSPYQFKHGKMSEEGLENIKQLISSGRAKVTSKIIGNTPKVGFETKAIEETGDPLEKEAKTLAFFIKKFGIKTRPFFKDAFEEVFGPLDYEIVEAAKKEFVAKLQFLNNQK